MDTNPRQQVVERIKDANNILVTVSKNPTVDQLSACIGFTLLLNKMGKHATAVFSGAVPSTIEFLQPEKTIEQTTDSLRDFIIALDKSKADKLRYKVEDEVVRIFITPYRTSISEKDLDFSQGDFNVDVVVALGVTTKEDIDQAIVAHGRILHDATVLSITNGQTVSDVGSINWHDDTASSLSEMLVSVSDSLQTGQLDGQMATAFLTGIVSETDRFSNEKTSPKVMTMSAQLMAAGANQQLIATKLTPEPEPVPEPVAEQSGEDNVEPYTPPTETEEPEQELDKPNKDGEIEISHEEPHEEPREASEEEVSEDEIHIDDQGNLKRQQELAAAEEERKIKEAEEQAKKDDVDVPVDQEGSYLAGASHKIVQPLADTVIDPLAAFAPRPNPDSSLEPSVDEEVLLPPVAVPSIEPQQPDTTPLVGTPIPGPSMQNSTITQPEPSWSLPTPPVPLTPVEPVADTLSSLEEAVQSPHIYADKTPEEVVAEARAAVQTAGLDSAPRPEATQSVGAQIVDMGDKPQQAVPPAMSGVGDILQQTSAATPDPTAVVDPMAPPPVPPPMMPQYFTPQNNGHAYLNPSDQLVDTTDATLPPA